jgi:peptidoglycan/LPS O-acetylase OafA/YrhL
MTIAQPSSTSTAPLPPTLTGPDRDVSGFAGTAPRRYWLFERLQRVTSSGRFIPQIDGLRFVAIATVILYHVNMYLVEKGAYGAQPPHNWLRFVVEHGHNGVQLFFIISGFVLGLPFATWHLRGGKPVSLRKYFLRRVTRLEPPYILCLLLFFALRVVALGSDPVELLPHLGASLAYLHTMIYGTLSLINPVAWSLEVEIQFYLLVPLLAKLFTISDRLVRRFVIAALIAGAVAFQMWYHAPAINRFTLSILGQIQFFLLGFLLADIYVTDWRSEPAATGGWDLVSLVGWPLLPFVWTNVQVSKWVFPPIAFALYLAAFRGTWSRRVFANGWLTTIGGMCYTIYLIHYPIITNVSSRAMRFQPFQDSVVGTYLFHALFAIPAILVISSVYFLLIEKPCMDPDWPRKLVAFFRRRAPRQATS